MMESTLGSLPRRDLCHSSPVQHTEPPAGTIQTIKGEIHKKTVSSDSQAAATVEIHNHKSPALLCAR